MNQLDITGAQLKAHATLSSQVAFRISVIESVLSQYGEEDESGNVVTLCCHALQVAGALMDMAGEPGGVRGDIAAWALSGVEAEAMRVLREGEVADAASRP